jgi:hypothetical protein
LHITTAKKILKTFSVHKTDCIPFSRRHAMRKKCEQTIREIFPKVLPEVASRTASGVRVFWQGFSVEKQA